MSYQNDQSSSSTLSQLGAFTGGAFSLGTVTYAGSSNNSFNASDVGVSSWSGGYSGKETVAHADSSSNVQTVSATGNFAGGSWSLSSYVLQGSSQQADSSSTTRYQSMGTTGFSGSTYAISDASTGSSTLYQSGTQSAGTYANASYAYRDAAVATLAAIAQSMGVTSGETRTEIAGSTIILGGTQQIASAATYSYDQGWGATTKTNSGSQSSDQPTAAPVVQFGTPDASMVPAAGVGQLVGVAQTQSSAMPVAAAQPAAGYLTPGGAAPVPMSVNMRAVAATADWSNATVYASQRAVSNWSRQMTLHGFEPASGPAVEALTGRAAGASFGLLAWKALEPALKVAQWGQATAASGPILQLLLLDDDSGALAQYIFGQMDFTSNSSDPLVREIDNMLYNDGQPLTAGSAPLYGTYWDGKARSAQDALAKVGPFWSAGVNIVAAMWIIGPTALIGVAGPAIGALTSAGQGLIPNIIGGADAETIASDFGSQFLEGAVMGGLGVLGGGAQSARAPARGPILEATMLEHGGGFRPGGRPRVRLTGPIEQPAGRGGVNRGGTPPFNPSNRSGGTPPFSRGGMGGLGQRMTGAADGLGGTGTPKMLPPPGTVVNRNGDPYPTIIDPRTGRAVRFPETLARTPRSSRVKWGAAERKAFKDEWESRFGEPPGGWGKYHIHHIQPKEWGGTNAFDNLVPVEKGFHTRSVTPWWNNFAGR